MNNILDEIEKYTGPRTCPECGYQFPFKEFVRKYVMSLGLSRWSCKSCRVTLKCDFVKIQILWLVGLVVSGILCGVLSAYFNLTLLNIIFVVLSFAFMLLTLYYLKFEKYS